MVENDQQRGDCAETVQRLVAVTADQLGSGHSNRDPSPNPRGQEPARAWGRTQARCATNDGQTTHAGERALAGENAFFFTGNFAIMINFLRVPQKM
jgi:hypothetical protein